jgi:hypothetical protein
MQKIEIKCVFILNTLYDEYLHQRILRRQNGKAENMFGKNSWLS